MTDINIDNRVKHLHTKARSLLTKKKNDEEIITELTKEGIDSNYAVIVLENVKNDIYDKKEFWKHLIMGSIIVIAGLAINYLSYNHAEETGSGYFLALWGVVVIGIIIIMRGIIIFRK